ncbi:MAG TPA: radical SAM protein, partial [Bdellovibrionales bacterium]|nr:radical SAM protein [Bdellovibrionales bacterium]
ADLRSPGGKVYRRAGRVDHLTRDMNVLEKLRLWTRQSDGSNPYVEAFWKWWPELSRNLTELRVTGGEPLLSPDFWKLVERFQTERPNVRLAVNSNLGVKTESIDRLAQAARELPTLEVYTSCEAFGAAAEYIRDGMDYRQWRDNVFKLHRAGVRKIHVMMTINALCLFSLTDLFDDILSWRHELDPEIGSFTLNILRFPAFQNVLVLPEETRRERARHLTAWLDRQKSEPYLYDMEIAEIRRLVEYLEKVPRAHDREPARRVLWDDFQSFYRQYDIRRGKSLADAIPALSSVR